MNVTFKNKKPGPFGPGLFAVYLLCVLFELWNHFIYQVSHF